MLIAGETLQARGDRTLFWPAESTLFVADLHLGKGAAFRAGGLPVPKGTTAATLDALGKAAEDAKPQRIVILGDLWHARHGRTEENRAAFAAWRAERSLEILLVLGNHDRHAGWELDAVAPGVTMGPFALHHFPDPDPNGYVLCGHLHPGFDLSGFGGDRLRLPCFWFGDRVGVLPAFGDLTGIAPIRGAAGDRIVVVAEEKVAMVPAGDRSAGRRR